MINQCTPGMSLAEIHKASSRQLVKELNKIGFNLRGSDGAGDVDRVLYPHYVGHSIGIGTLAPGLIVQDKNC